MSSSTMLRLGIMFVLAAQSVSHSPPCVGQEPRIAGIAPAVSVSIGYAYLHSEVPSAGRINENGIASGVTTEFTRRIGIKAEVSYTRTHGAFGVDHDSDVLAYLGGPVVYPVRNRRFSIYAQALIGAARITGVIPVSNGNYLSAETNKLAWSLGPGIDMRLSRSTVLRVGADYLHSSYFAPSKAIQGQGNIRVIISLAYTLGKVR
jgi:opacity protein-like surface antigen